MEKGHEHLVISQVFVRIEEEVCTQYFPPLLGQVDGLPEGPVRRQSWVVMWDRAPRVSHMLEVE